ncbi:hypothetical protein Dsin_025451, partial [Dipteronia sinensis]
MTLMILDFHLMWLSLVQTAKEKGEDAIESYVFWNGHELSPGKYYMQRFTTVIVNLMKKEKLFASLGGPIILSQTLVGFFQTSNLSSCLLGVGVP